MAAYRESARGLKMGDGLPEWLNMLVTGIGGLGVGAYAVARKLKADKNSDTLDAKSQGIITRLESQLETERKNNAHFGEVIDRLAKERNEAVQKVGRLEGAVQALQGEIKRLEQKNASLTQEITSLHEEVRMLSGNIATLIEQFTARPAEGGQQ